MDILSLSKEICPDRAVKTSLLTIMINLAFGSFNIKKLFSQFKVIPVKYKYERGSIKFLEPLPEGSIVCIKYDGKIIGPKKGSAFKNSIMIDVSISMKTVKYVNVKIFPKKVQISGCQNKDHINSIVRFLSKLDRSVILGPYTIRMHNTNYKLPIPKDKIIHLMNFAKLATKFLRMPDRRVYVLYDHLSSKGIRIRIDRISGYKTSVTIYMRGTVNQSSCSISETVFIKRELLKFIEKYKSMDLFV